MFLEKKPLWGPKLPLPGCMLCGEYLPNEAMDVKDTGAKADAASKVPCVEFACSSIPVPSTRLNGTIGKMWAFGGQQWNEGRRNHRIHCPGLGFSMVTRLLFRSHVMCMFLFSQVPQWQCVFFSQIYRLLML